MGEVKYDVSQYENQQTKDKTSNEAHRGAKSANLNAKILNFSRHLNVRVVHVSQAA
jgi:hypothetical protein